MNANQLIKHPEFWEYIEKLVAGTEVVIDRPKGKPHPRFADFIYPLDYGYLKGTESTDGGGIDVWCGSMSEPVITGVIVTVDLTKKDSEIKILLGCTDEDKEVIFGICNEVSMRAVLINREEEV